MEAQLRLRSYMAIQQGIDKKKVADLLTPTKLPTLTKDATIEAQLINLQLQRDLGVISEEEHKTLVDRVKIYKPV
jgi:hypothetical protein